MVTRTCTSNSTVLEIRLALGGVDDIDFGMASTAYEIKTLYGRVAATAEKKARALFTYGLCKLFSLMIKHEETMFNESFAVAVGLEKPDHSSSRRLPRSCGIRSCNEKYMKQLATVERRKQEALRATLESGEMPPGVTGLVPDGSTKVDWRWMGEVFEDSSDEILQNSIVVRNLQEAGVGSIEALKYLFPNKTEEERAAMMSGFPFRVVQQTQQAFNHFVGMLGNLYQLPHPQTPDLPLASDPNLDITGFLYRSLDYLRKELSYSGKYKPSSSDDSRQHPQRCRQAPRRPSAAQVRDERNNPHSRHHPRCPRHRQPGRRQAAQASQASAAAGNPWQEAFQALSASLNTSSPSQAQVPYSAYQTPTPQASYPGQLGFSSPNPAPSPVFGAGDLQSPSFNPGLQPGEVQPLLQMQQAASNFKKRSRK